MKITKIAYTLIALIAMVIILVFGKDILIPFVLALIVWFLIRQVKAMVGKIKIKDKSLPSWLISIFSFAIIILILGGIVQMLKYNMEQVIEKLPEYEKNIGNIAGMINNQFNIDIYSIIQEQFSEYNFSGIIQSIIESISGIIGNAFMVIIYVLFLMAEESIFPLKLKAIYRDKEKYNIVSDLLTKVNKSVNVYISLKTLVSIITGVASYVVLLIIGIDFPLFWAFLIFILNFIPTVGSLLGTIFPAIIALLQFGDFTNFFIVLAGVGAIQIVVGNYVEPKVMGKSLNISLLVTILSLAFWGAIWGVLGMLLCVPITVIIILILAEFPSTRGIAIMLSGNRGLE